MRMTIAAVGRMKAGAERDLVDRYAERARKAGRNLGITKIDIRDIAESRATASDRRRDEEADRLVSDIPPDAQVVVLDETGKAMTSRAFADWIARQRDSGAGDMHFLIGGPDGHGASARSRANLTLSLGAMTFPHQIARILIVEQIYRVMTILGGHPYHRD